MKFIQMTIFNLGLISAVNSFPRRDHTGLDDSNISTLVNFGVSHGRGNNTSSLADSSPVTVVTDPTDPNKLTLTIDGGATIDINDTSNSKYYVIIVNKCSTTVSSA